MTFVHFGRRVTSIEFVSESSPLCVLIALAAGSGPDLYCLFGSEKTLYGLRSAVELRALARDAQERPPGAAFIGALTADGAFAYFRVRYDPFPALSREETIAREETAFTAFQFGCVGAERRKRVYVGGRNGRVYLYAYGGGPATLDFVYGRGTNFWVGGVCAVGGERDGDALIAAALGDGALQFFGEHRADPLTEFAFQNEALRCLFWDANINLLYYLNDAHANSLFALILFKEKRGERVKRILREERRILHFEASIAGNFFAVVCEDATVKLGTLSELRAATLSSKKAAMRLGELLSFGLARECVALRFIEGANFHRETPRARSLSKGFEFELNSSAALFSAFRGGFVSQSETPNAIALATNGGHFALCFVATPQCDES